MTSIHLLAKYDLYQDDYEAKVKIDDMYLAFTSKATEGA